MIPIYGRGPPSPPRSRSSSQSHSTSKKVPRALRFVDVFLLPYLKSPSSTKTITPPRPQAKRLPPRSILQNSPFYMLLQSAQRHYPFLPEGTVLAIPQNTSPRFGRPHLFMLIFAIWAALFKMMADSGRSWRAFLLAVAPDGGSFESTHGDDTKAVKLRMLQAPQLSYYLPSLGRQNGLLKSALRCVSKS